MILDKYSHVKEELKICICFIFTRASNVIIKVKKEIEKEFASEEN
jgi:hypothetical protein